LFVIHCDVVALRVGKTWWSVGKKNDIQGAPTENWFDTQSVRALTDRLHYGDGWTTRPNWVLAKRGISTRERERERESERERDVCAFLYRFMLCLCFVALNRPVRADGWFDGTRCLGEVPTFAYILFCTSLCTVFLGLFSYCVCIAIVGWHCYTRLCFRSSKFLCCKTDIFQFNCCCCKRLCLVSNSGRCGRFGWSAVQRFAAANQFANSSTVRCYNYYCCYYYCLLLLLLFWLFFDIDDLVRTNR
jgi:hypothetical protein